MSIDIVLPFYGDPSLLRAAVRSVQCQQDPDWRLTVVDDGYPDATVPEWFANLEDDRIHYRRNSTNLGANGNYRLCCDMIEAELAVLMGADDVMLPNYVRRIKQLHERFPEAGVIQCGVELIDGSGKRHRNLVDTAKKRWYAPRVRSPRVLAGEELATSLLRGNWLYFPALAWRKRTLRSVEFRPGLAVVQDLALVIDLVLRGESMVVDNEVSFQYRRHRASDSSVRALSGQRFREQRRYFLDIADELDDRGWNRAAATARTHLSSRIHAVSLLPSAVRRRDAAGLRELTEHAFASPKRRQVGRR